ncbi:methyltransferase domain-containing protein [Streptomyces sp. NPDC057555]|uniref:methyltransferase domain-containing protein n=1 Tax=Streptomyces sp. NPDC057555 TaxID=3346166 RepID=UPI0036CD5B0C
MTQQPPPAGGNGRPAHPDHPDGAARPELPDRVAATYGPEDLSTVPAFTGGFINFGYWAWLPEPADRPLTEEDRLRSEQDLYRLVLDTVDRPRGHTALEVGCGRGLGCALALREFDFASVIGLDAHPDQIARALEANAALLAHGAGPRRLEFVLGPAQRMPLPDACADVVYSVEAAQHFRDMAGFARETVRVLRPGGHFALATFLARVPDAVQVLPELLPPYADGLDVTHLVDDVAATFDAAGLRDIAVTPIGDGVWESYDRYMAQRAELRDKWPRQYLTAYQTGLLDYYLITASAPAG